MPTRPHSLGKGPGPEFKSPRIGLGGKGMKREATRGKILEPLKIAEDVQNENTIASCDVSHNDLRDRTSSVKATTGKQNDGKQRSNKVGVSNTTLEPLKHTPIIKTA